MHNRFLKLLLLLFFLLSNIYALGILSTDQIRIKTRDSLFVTVYSIADSVIHDTLLASEIHVIELRQSTKPETLYLSIQDSLLFTLISFPDTSLKVSIVPNPEANFFDRHETLFASLLGVIIGAFVTLVIAVYTVWLESTRRKKREESTHTNIVACMLMEIKVHRKRCTENRKKWNNVKARYIHISESLLKSLHFHLSTENLDHYYRRLVDIEELHTDELLELSDYIDECNNFNKHLQLNLIDDPHLYVAQSNANFIQFRKDLRRMMTKITNKSKKVLSVYERLYAKNK